MSTPICPRCPTETLIHAESGGHSMLACTRCAGVWLDTVHAAPLLAPLTDLRDRPASYAPLPCPRCGGLMPAQHSAMANVEVDRCWAHGVWFDRDEVAHVAHAIAFMRGEPPPALPSPYAQTVASHGHPHHGIALAGAAVGVAAMVVAAQAQPASAPRSAASGHGYEALEAVAAVPDLAELAVHGAATTVEVTGDAVQALSGAGDAVDVVAGVGDAVSNAGDAAEVLSGAGELLGSLLEGLGGLFEGL